MPEDRPTLDPTAIVPTDTLPPPPPGAVGDPAEVAFPPALAARYDILDRLGAGGMGAVWRVRDRVFLRELAVKVLLPAHAREGRAGPRFLEEARIAAQLPHPGVVPVHDFGELADGRPFFTMKLVKGRTLAELLRARAGPGDESGRFLQIVEQVCQAVAYAHAKGVVHRDLKPSNVMVGAFGEVQVMDWGLAKVLDGPDRVEEARPGPAPASVVIVPREADSDTRTGSVLGTYAYMPPEQARGEIDRVGKGSDVFALGAILCEVLTGRPPYAGSADDLRPTAELGLLGPAYARLAECGADPALVALATDCLARDPADRPADAGAVAVAMAAYRQAVEDRLRAAEREQAAAAARAAEARKRRQVWAGLGGLAAAAVALGAVGWAAAERRRAAAVEAEADRRAQADRVAYDALAQARQAATVAGAGRWPPATVTEAEDMHEAEVRLDRWRAAEALLDRAAAAAAAGPPHPARDDELRAARAEVTAAADRARWNYRAAEARKKFVVRVRRARDDMTYTLRNWSFAFDLPAKAERYVAAVQEFRLYEVELGTADDVIARIAQEPDFVRDAFLDAADDWPTAVRGEVRRTGLAAITGGMAAVPDPFAEKLFAVAQRLDPSAFRRRLREARWAGDAAAVRALAAEFDTFPAIPWPTTVVPFQLVGGLWRAGDYEAADRIVRRVYRERPDDYWANLLMADLTERTARGDRVRLMEACGYLRAAIALRPDVPAAYVHLGKIQHFAFRDFAGAAATYARLVAAAPADASFRNELGRVLFDAGDLAAAEPHFRKAVELDPRQASALGNLGLIAQRRKDWAAAVEYYRQGLAIDRTDWLTERLAEAEQYQRQERQLAQWRAGDVQRLRLGDRVALAKFAAENREDFAVAVALWREAFAAEPALADDPDAAPRVAAAKAACRAAEAGGAAGLRREALGWLRDELAAWGKRPPAAAGRAVAGWLTALEFAPVRDAAGLAKLPADERREWEQFWDAVRAKAGP